VISRRHLLSAGAAGGLLLPLLAGCAAQRQPLTPDGRYPIMDLLEDSGQHARLVAALNRSGVAETLKGPGPFTIFAPTDAALARVPQFEQMPPERQAAALRSIVARGRLRRGDIAARDGVILMIDGSRVRVAPGAAQVFRFASADGRPVAQGSGAPGIGPMATISRPDLLASNGVIHVVDMVLL
jgi:hypothetical protein